MKKSVAVKTEETGSSTETKTLIKNTPRRMSDHKIEASPSASVMFEEIACQFKAVIDPLTH